MNGFTGELVEPAKDGVEGGAASDVVDEEGGDGAAVVGGGDGAESLLAGGVPDLSLDLSAVDLHRLSLELDADRGLGVGVELVPREPRQQVRLPNRRVADQHDLEQVLLLLRRLFFPSSPHLLILFPKYHVYVYICNTSSPLRNWRGFAYVNVIIIII